MGDCPLRMVYFQKRTVYTKDVLEIGACSLPGTVSTHLIHAPVESIALFAIGFMKIDGGVTGN